MDSFKKPRNKNWGPTNKRHSIETFAEAARKDVKKSNHQVILT